MVADHTCGSGFTMSLRVYIWTFASASDGRCEVQPQVRDTATVDMGYSAPNMQLPDAATILQSVNATIGHTAYSFPTSGYQVFLSVLRTLLILLFLFVTYHCFHYFTCELPPFGSGLKALPGPRSTLPYLGRVHDVDRMQAWTSMHKFSKQYGGLFACTLGGETHIWVAREDVAQDLMVKNAELSSARADIGSFPGVTQDFLYLPLLGYTGMSAITKTLI